MGGVDLGFLSNLTNLITEEDSLNNNEKNIAILKNFNAQMDSVKVLNFDLSLI